MKKRAAQKKQKRLLKQKARAEKKIEHLGRLQTRLDAAETPEEIHEVEKAMGPDNELKFKTHPGILKHEFLDAEARLKDLGHQRDEKDAEIDRLQKISGRIKNILREGWMRLGGVITPQTLGEYLQGLIIFSALLEARPQLEGIDIEDWEGVISNMSEFRNYGLKANRHLKAYVPQWKADGYARVAVGHKLSSALMLTSVPDEIEVKAPWNHWILEVPDGLYPLPVSPTAFQEALDEWDKNKRSADITVSPVKRGDEVNGEVRAFLCKGPVATHMIIELRKAFVCLKLSEEGNKAEIRNYVKGVCISFHDRKHVQESRWGRSSKASRSGPPGLGCHYVLSKPVTVDFRNEVRSILSGSKKHTLTAQFLVRGHWRNQACGKWRQERKPIWIEPYWKGPEDSRVLLRGYDLQGSTKPQG